MSNCRHSCPPLLCSLFFLVISPVLFVVVFVVVVSSIFVIVVSSIFVASRPSSRRSSCRSSCCLSCRLCIICPVVHCPHHLHVLPRLGWKPPTCCCCPVVTFDWLWSPKSSPFSPLLLHLSLLLLLLLLVASVLLFLLSSSSSCRLLPLPHCVIPPSPPRSVISLLLVISPPYPSFPPRHCEPPHSSSSRTSTLLRFIVNLCPVLELERLRGGSFILVGTIQQVGVFGTAWL